MSALVTCICPTHGTRREWLPKAIACFVAQTYDRDSLRMLIVADFPGDTEGLIPADDPRISVVVTGSKLTVGEKRNIGCGHASDSELVCHFDSDDYSAPGRVADQVKRLTDTNKSVTGYHSPVFTDGTKYWKYLGDPRDWAFDGSLCYRRTFWEENPFDEINDGLEARFRLAACKAKQFVAADGDSMLQVSIHDDNTSKIHVHTGANWKKIAAPTRS